MKRIHPLVVFAGLVALLSLTACVPIGPDTTAEDAGNASQPLPSTQSSSTQLLDTSKYENIWVKAIEEIDNEGRSLLRVSYPFTEHEAIDARMEAVTQEFIDDYRRTAAEIEAAYQAYKADTGKEAATFVTQYRQHFDVSAADESLLFFDLVRSIQTGGTGNSYVVGYIFDRRSGAELAISDLFVDESYLERLSILTREALKKRISRDELASDPDWVDDGTTPTPENFDNILFGTDSTFLVRFDKYQVAAGVAGVVEVELPLSEIADLLTPEVRAFVGDKSDSGDSAVGVVETIVVEESDNDDRSQLYISHPFTALPWVNDLVSEISQAFVDEYTETAAETEEAYQKYKKETGKEAASFVTYYRLDHETTVVNDALMFVALERSRHTGGTGNTTVSSHVFDLRNRVELPIPALFEDESYLRRLSQLTRKSLEERARSLIAEREPDADQERRDKLFEMEYPAIEAGTEPLASNFDCIVFQDDETVLIRFDKYQVASGAEGVVEVELAVSALADLLTEEVRELMGIELDSTRRKAGLAAASDIPGIRKTNVVLLTAGSFNQSFTGPASGLVESFQSVRQSISSSEEDINCQEIACVALTFDDGPSYYTEGLLDTLKEKNVKATFFVLGTQVRIQSETVARMFREGHEIGNHTWDHPNLTSISDEHIREQLRLTDDLILQVIGETTPFLRPPYGAYNDRVLAASGLPIIFWSVDPIDWRDRDAATVAARIVDSPAGAIILSHDIHKSTVEAVPAIIDALRGRGIQFVTVTKLFEPQALHAGQVYKSQPDSPSVE